MCAIFLIQIFISFCEQIPSKMSISTNQNSIKVDFNESIKSHMHSDMDSCIAIKMWNSKIYYIPAIQLGQESK